MDKNLTEKKRKKARKGSSMARRQNRLGYFFMSPWILGFLVFTLFPFVTTVALSFCSVSSTIKGYEISFIGLDNYYTAFFRNTEFVPALLSFLVLIPAAAMCFFPMRNQLKYPPYRIALHVLLLFLVAVPFARQNFSVLTVFMALCLLTRAVSHMLQYKNKLTS